MSQPTFPVGADAPAPQFGGPPPPALARPQPASLADVLERVLDKGIVIAGDIRINLVDVELLTIRVRLLVASVDRAREMGIDWWEHDSMLSSRARTPTARAQLADGDGGGPDPPSDRRSESRPEGETGSTDGDDDR